VKAEIERINFQVTKLLISSPVSHDAVSNIKGATVTLELVIQKKKPFISRLSFLI
jgi:hypothetical protein